MRRETTTPLCLGLMLILITLCLSDVSPQNPRLQRDSAGVITTFDEHRLFREDGTPRHDFASPDGKYLVRLEHAKEGGYINLHILKRRRIPKHNRGERDAPRSVTAVQEDVTSFAWIPGRPHALVVATSDMYGWAGIRYWNGGTSVKGLAGRSEAPRRSYTGRLQMYVLTRVDRGGRYVYYECWNVDGSHLLHRGALKLPAR